MYFLHSAASDLASLKSKHIHYKQVQQSEYLITPSTVAISENLHSEVDIYFKILAFYFSVTIRPLY